MLIMSKFYVSADILFCHSRKSTGVSNNINDDCVQFKSENLGSERAEAGIIFTTILFLW